MIDFFGCDQSRVFPNPLKSDKLIEFFLRRNKLCLYHPTLLTYHLTSRTRQLPFAQPGLTLFNHSFPINFLFESQIRESVAVQLPLHHSKYLFLLGEHSPVLGRGEGVEISHAQVFSFFVGDEAHSFDALVHVVVFEGGLSMGECLVDS